jgi:L-histidine N-alpha-methyltransferase
MSVLIEDPLTDFAREVIAGLGQRQKAISARYLYDARGSELFEEITGLPEYYPTRTEVALLKAHANDLRRLNAGRRTVVEFGAGSSTKSRLLLDALDTRTYVPIDISGDYLRQSAARLGHDYPDLRILPVVGDFTQSLSLPQIEPTAVGFFPGSTIGNFAPRAAVDLLRVFRDSLGDASSLVIGIDLRKNPRLLEAAYDDAAGVTAAFNLNLLWRINRELDGNIPVEAFQHRAVWHDGLGRIEMHLVAERDVAFRAAGRSFSMRAGETIHSENSHKYSLEEARLLARASGWEPEATWVDPDHLFSLHVWSAAPTRPRP